MVTLGKDFNILWVKQTPEIISDNIMASPHLHHFYEVYYVISGSSRFVIEGHVYDITPNTLLVISPFVNHINIMRSPDYERIIIELPPETLQQPLHSLGVPDISDMIKDKWIILSDGHTEYRQTLLMSIGDAFATKPMFFDARIRLLLADLIIYICTTAKDSGIRGGEGVPLLKNEAVMKVISFLNAHYTEPINLDNLADEFHTEKTYLCKVFKKTLGITVWDYLTMLRVQRACAMLITTNDKIIDIAHISGFGGIANFERALKKITGCSPTKYRKERMPGNRPTFWM